MRTVNVNAAVMAALLARAVSGKTVGSYESKDCVDPAGFETCYDDADQAYASCVQENCSDQTSVDCNYACRCVQTLDYLNCAGQSCWNRVYSCEYQETVNDLTIFCAKPDLDAIPFWPPPDDGSYSCSCNLGKMALQLYQTSDNFDACTNDQDFLDSASSAGEIAAHLDACRCCADSAWLSSYYDICPDTDPAVIGFDDIYDTLVSGDDNWPSQCSDYMEQFSCASDLGFTSPDALYAPDDFPANGTQTLFNTGTPITSPPAGPTYSYTYGSVTYTVVVSSADAKPTGDGDSDGDGSDGNDNDSDGGGGGDSEGENQAGDDDGDSGAATLLPGKDAVSYPLAAVLAAVVFLL